MEQRWLPPTPPSGPWQPASEPRSPLGPAQEQRPPLLKRLLGPLVVAALLLVKFAAKLKGLLLLVGKAKFLTTSASMLVSVAAYALIWGWVFAAGFVALLFIHEMGHYIQLRREGIRPGMMVFIPFLGAAVTTKSLGGNAVAEARVGLAGPVLGSLAAAALVPVAIATDSDLLRALAFTGFFLNLFNLVPVSPLDGGRAAAAMAPWMWFAGLGIVVAMVFVFPSPILILIALLGGLETWRRWRNRHAGEEGNPDYYRVPTATRWIVFGVWLGLVVGLAVGMDLTFIERDFDDV
jgi:Zn-dependent protease